MEFFFILLVYTYFRAKGYYAIGLYPIYIAFGSVFLGHLLRQGKKKILQPTTLIITILLFIPILSVAFPTSSPEEMSRNNEQYKKLGLLRWEDGKDHLLPQDFADMLGWKELANKVDEAYSQMPDPQNTLVVCDNYGEAGAINYYTTKDIKAVSFSADYINWFDLIRQYKNLIRVKEYSRRNNELEKTSPYFRFSSIADSITNEYAREYGTTIFSFVQAKININEHFEKEIENYRSTK